MKPRIITLLCFLLLQSIFFSCIPCKANDKAIGGAIILTASSAMTLTGLALTTILWRRIYNKVKNNENYPSWSVLAIQNTTASLLAGLGLYETISTAYWLES